MAQSKWDIDLTAGLFAEKLVIDILGDARGTLEVKRDFKVSDTGNIAIEYRYRNKPSGIAATKATWWALVLDGPRYGHEIIVLIRTERLKQIARSFYKANRITHGGDRQDSFILGDVLH